MVALCKAGLGVGLFLGYRVGFMARPIPRSYEKEHFGQKYNIREDGLIECALGETTNYIKVKLINSKVGNRKLSPFEIACKLEVELTFMVALLW